MLFLLLFDFFNRNDLTALRMIKKAVKGGHCGAEYVFAVISIFEGGISMREGLMYIANIKKHVSNSEKSSTPFAVHFKSNVGART